LRGSSLDVWRWIETSGQSVGWPENRHRGAGHRSLVAFGPIEKIQRGIDLFKLIFNLASFVSVFCQLKLLDEFVLPRVQVAYDC
jgi:hypothetical protein